MFLVMSIHELLRWAIFPNPKLIQQRVATGLVKLNTCQLEFLNLNFSFFFGGGEDFSEIHHHLGPNSQPVGWSLGQRFQPFSPERRIPNLEFPSMASVYPRSVEAFGRYL